MDPEGVDGSGFTHGAMDGEPLDVDAILATAAPREPEPEARDLPEFEGAPAGMGEAAGVLAAAWPKTSRHQASLALCGALARAGWPEEMIGQFAAEVSEQAQPGNGLLREKRLPQARSSVEKVRAGEAVAGWPSLIALLGAAGPDAVHRACELLDIPTSIPLRDEKLLQAFADALPEPEPVSQALLLAHIEGAVRALGRSRAPDKIVARDLLKRVHRGDFISDRIEDRTAALAHAAVAVWQVAPPGTTAEQVCSAMTPSAGAAAADLAEIAVAARPVAAGLEPLVVPPKPPRAERDQRPPPDSMAEPQDDDQLRGLLVLDKKEEGFRASPKNIELILRFAADVRGQMRFNVVTKEIEVTGGRFQGTTAGTLDTAVMNWLESHWQICAKSIGQVNTQITYVARTWYPHDPVAEYLDHLVWDGVPRLDSWLVDYLRAETDDWYASRVGSMFMVSAVARALDPGCKVDTVLVLIGEQGIKKSQSWSILGGNWFSDTPLVMGDKDSRLLAQSRWIVELAELKSLLSDEEASKAFLSQRQDDFRVPYGRTVEKFNRRCVFAGTTNEEEFLKDPTGNRRYRAIRIVGVCDTESLSRDRDQLWAEAVRRYRSAELNPDLADRQCPGERWWFSDAEEVLARPIIDRHRLETPWADMIRDWLKTQQGPTGPSHQSWTTPEVAQRALQLGSMEIQRQIKDVRRACKEAGLRLVDRVWVRAGAKPQAQVVDATAAEAISPENPN